MGLCTGLKPPCAAPSPTCARLNLGTRRQGTRNSWLGSLLDDADAAAGSALAARPRTIVQLSPGRDFCPPLPSVASRAVLKVSPLYLERTPNPQPCGLSDFLHCLRSPKATFSFRCF